MNVIKKKIYAWINKSLNKKMNSEKRETLEQLYPGENFLAKYRSLQVKKYMLMLMIIMAGMVAAVCTHLSSRMQSRLVEGTYLYRNEWGEGNYTVTLQAITEWGKEKYDYEVKERILTKEETMLLKEQLAKELPTVILGSNESPEAVKEDLNLATQIKGYPVSVSWQSSDYSRVRADGKVSRENLLPEGEEVILTAYISYEDEHWQQKIAVRLIPKELTPKELYSLQTEDAILESDRLYEKSHEIFLPEKIGNTEIIWKESKKDKSIFCLMLGFLGAISILFLSDEKLRQKRKLRQEEVIRCYPEFVSRLQLYMGAGLTPKNAFFRIGRDYQKEKNRTGKKQFLYEEVLLANYQLINGRPENIVYREWGRRCGEMKYRKLGFLLASQIRQGNDRILTLLSEETDIALEERRNRARKQGEEAGTKLLFPMMIQLIIVMFLILIPAFSGFGNM